MTQTFEHASKDRPGFPKALESEADVILIAHPEVVTIEDLGSTNGTYVNGQPVHGRTVLRSGG